LSTRFLRPTKDPELTGVDVTNSGLLEQGIDLKEVIVVGRLLEGLDPLGGSFELGRRLPKQTRTTRADRG